MEWSSEFSCAFCRGKNDRRTREPQKETYRLNRRRMRIGGWANWMKAEARNRRSRRNMSRYLSRFRELMRRANTEPLETLQDAPDLFRVYRELLQQPSVKRKPGGWEYKGKF